MWNGMIKLGKLIDSCFSYDKNGVIIIEVPKWVEYYEKA